MSTSRSLLSCKTASAEKVHEGGRRPSVSALGKTSEEGGKPNLGKTQKPFTETPAASLKNYQKRCQRLDTTGNFLQELGDLYAPSYLAPDQVRLA